jgi:hypothetical protein
VILFVSGATPSVRRYLEVGELIVPAARNRPETLRLRPGWWAMDNGAFSQFDAELFVRMLEDFHGRSGCRFVAAPDRVADAHQTLLQWPFWSRLIRGVGFVPALVAQDGLTVEDVPWKEIGALFIGGLDPWKLGPQATELIAYAKARGLWVHMGRLNSEQRIWRAEFRGVDSFDGSRHSWFPDTHIPNTLDSLAQGRFL